MKFAVYQVTKEEQAKAIADPNYTPKEYCAGHIDAPTEERANEQLRRLIKRRRYDKTAMLFESKKNAES